MQEKTRGRLGTRSLQNTEQENSWWPDNIGIPGSEEHVRAVCEGISPEQAERVPWTEGIPKYYLTTVMFNADLGHGAGYPGQGRVLRTQYCLCTYTGNNSKEASTPGHVFGEPPVDPESTRGMVSLEPGPQPAEEQEYPPALNFKYI